MTDVSLPDPLDGPPLDGLDRAFQLPPAIEEDQSLVELHLEIVTRLRREAAGIAMNTVQNLLLERIATQYVMTKLREDTGALSLRDMKEQNSVFLAMTQQFNNILVASEDKLRDALFKEMQNILMGSLDLIPDDAVRRDVRRYLAGEFAAIEQ